MKIGQIVTIAEGDYAGKQGKIVAFDGENPTIEGIATSPITIQKDWISIDDEVKRIWMVYGEETRPKPVTVPSSRTNTMARKPEELPIPPRVRHFTKVAAMEEMDNLAKKYPNKQFYLLESVADLKYEMELTRKERIYD